MRMHAVSVFGLLAVLAGTAVAGEAVKFAEPPVAVREGDQTRITFALSAAADVEVAVIDKDGKPVRHLAAGLLGNSAPSPFAKDTLKQQITWDGKNDSGQPAGAGPFKVRVRAGLSGATEKVVGWDANTTTGPILGVAVNDAGEIFALDGDGRMKVFDRAGKYLRTIMPYSATTPKERLDSVGQLDLDGQRVPVVYNAHPDNLMPDAAGSIYPFTIGLVRQHMAVGPKGEIYMASALGTHAHHGLPRHLLALSPQGGAADGLNFVGPLIREPNNFLGGAGERGVPWMDHLAVSPDGQWVYLSQGGEYVRGKLGHGIFRVKWTDAKLDRPFLGQMESGGDDTHFSQPQGVAVDKAGNIYVCDHGNNRVVIYSADAKRLGEFPTSAPEQIAVHPANGTIYVVSRGRDAKPPKRPTADSTLRKFSAWGAQPPKEQATLAVKTIETMALDPKADQPVIWAAIGRGYAAPQDLCPIADRGDKFELGKSIVNHTGLELPASIQPDLARNRLIVREREHMFLFREIYAVDIATGKKSPLFKKPLAGPVFDVDAAGNIYMASDYAQEGITRFDPAGKPAPFASGDGSHIAWPDKNPHWTRGIAVGPDGKIYVLRNIVRHVAGRVDVFGPDGKLVKEGLIDGLDRGACGLGVDPAGNIYVAVNIKPKGQPMPPPFTDKVPAKAWWFWYDAKLKPKLFGDRPAPWSYTYYNPYLYHFGSMVKFSPTGGTFHGLRPVNVLAKKGDPADPFTDPKNAPADAATFTTALMEREVKVAGALWVRQGYGLVPSQDCIWGDPGCACAMSGFAIDPFGRVFHPNVFRFCVEALDSAGNSLGRIGRYGNVDDKPASASDVIFAWPHFVSYADDRLFVSDGVNQRVMIVKLTYAAEAACEVK